MRDRLLASLFFAALLGLAPSAKAADMNPGDSCSGFPAGAYRPTGGQENPDGAFVVCDGTIWQPILRYSSAGNAVMFSSTGLPAAPVHVWGEAIIGNQGLACAAEQEGALRYTSNSDTWEYCDGASWLDLASGSGAPAAADPDRGIQFNSGGSFGADANFTFTTNGRLEIVSGGDSTFVGTNAGANDDGTSNRNTALGWDALQYNSSSGNNTAVGYRAARNVVGRNNTAVGRDALSSATGSDGIENVAVGWLALSANDGSSGSTAVGALALQNSTTANNTAVGQWAARQTTSSGANAVLGTLALFNNTTGSRNTAVGHYAMGNYSTASSAMSRNTAIGYHAGYVLEGGNNNVFLGHGAGSGVSSGSDNILIGYDVDASSATASNELNIGDVIRMDTTASGSVFVGGGAGANDDLTSNENTALGVNALQFVSSGIRNTAVGFEALQDHTGSGNTAFGHRAAANIEGNDSVAVGNNALAGAEGSTGAGNVAVGEHALLSVDTATQNTAVGFVAMENTTTGWHNVALGSWTLRTNTTGSDNIAIGHTALSNNTTGDANVAVGHGALGWTPPPQGSLRHH